MHKNQSKRLAKYSKRIRPPKPVKNPPLIYNSWCATLLLPALLAVIGGLLAWLIFSNTKALWLTNTLPLAFVMFISVFPASDIRLGEHSTPPQGRNHARRRQARIRLSEHSNPHQGHTTYKVIYRLTQDVSPSVRETLLQLPLFQKKLLLAYVLLLILPISLIYFWQSVTKTFWHMHVLPGAVPWGTVAGFFIILPPCLWLGRSALEKQYFLKFFVFMLCALVAYSYFVTQNIAWLSLLKQPRHTVVAEIRAYEKSNLCSTFGKNSTKYWYLQVRLPEPYNHFDGDWCSRFPIDSEPPATGSHTVYLRESRFARELTFEP